MSKSEWQSTKPVPPLYQNDIRIESFEWEITEFFTVYQKISFFKKYL